MEQQVEEASEPKELYTVLPGVKVQGAEGLMPTAHTYQMPGTEQPAEEEKPLEPVAEPEPEPEPEPVPVKKKKDKKKIKF